MIADLQKFDQAAAEIAKATGSKTLGLEVDVASERDLNRMAGETIKTFGRIDILVNNAAVFSSIELRPFENIPPEEFRRVMEVNILQERQVQRLGGKQPVHVDVRIIAASNVPLA